MKYLPGLCIIYDFGFNNSKCKQISFLKVIIINYNNWSVLQKKTLEIVIYST